MNARGASARAILSFSGRIARGPYLIAAIAATIVKVNGDRLLCGAIGVSWSPALYIKFPAPSIADLGPAGAAHVAILLAFALPFVWLGTALIAARLRDAALPLWLVPIFFIPCVGLIFGCVLAVWPSDAAGDAGTNAASHARASFLARIVPHGIVGSASAGAGSSALVGLPALVLGSVVLGQYGWGLFVAVPFVIGTSSALIFGARQPRTLLACYAVATIALALITSLLVAFAIEGLVCLVMAAPLVWAIALLGATFGWALQRRRALGPSVPAMLILFLASPAFMGAAALAPQAAPVFSVTTAIVVDAPPATVWRHVISFPTLPPPNEAAFKLGVAYPIRAVIRGSGRGAVRYCEFSTGDFIEPVTVWQPGHRLAFNVAHNPEPMRELSPYPDLQTRHLHGYMESLHGQFLLEPLPGGRTRLIGTTWYRHHLWPTTYWSLWSDAIVHEIHLRVLRHIARYAEADARAQTFERARWSKPAGSSARTAAP